MTPRICEGLPNLQVQLFSTSRPRRESAHAPRSRGAIPPGGTPRLYGRRGRPPPRRVHAVVRYSEQREGMAATHPLSRPTRGTTDSRKRSLAIELPAGVSLISVEFIRIIALSLRYGSCRKV